MGRMRFSTGNTSMPSADQPFTPSLDTVEVGAGAPEPLKCRVSEFLRGMDGGWCHVRPVPNCPFGLVYGHGLICQHPRCDLIVERTRRALPVAA